MSTKSRKSPAALTGRSLRGRGRAIRPGRGQRFRWTKKTLTRSQDSRPLPLAGEVTVSLGILFVLSHAISFAALSRFVGRRKGITPKKLHEYLTPKHPCQTRFSSSISRLKDVLRWIRDLSFWESAVHPQVCLDYAVVKIVKKATFRFGCLPGRRWIDAAWN
jgi:hypothetical protein